jgi:glycerol-3-phosphate acyltransferase PlsY
MHHFIFSDYLLFIGCYLLGSIPFGVIIARIAGLGDIRTKGSGNIGATNVARLGGKKLGVFTLLLDGGKGVVAVYLAREFSNIYQAELLAAALVVLGHVFPIFLKFKGGKGVATALSVLLVLEPVLGLSACAVWLIIFLLSRISSLSAICAMMAIPSVALLFASDRGYGIVYFTLFLSVLIVFRHHGNIRRLIAGEEGGF